MHKRADTPRARGALTDAATLARSVLRPRADGLDQIAGVWRQIVGASAAAQATPTRLTRDGVLTVRVTSSAAAHALSMQTARILAALGEQQLPIAVTQLRVRSGRAHQAAAPEPDSRLLRPPTQQEFDGAQQLVAPIANEELKARVRRARLAALRRQDPAS